MTKTKPLALRIVLDTNALFTGSAHFLMRKEVVDLIALHKKTKDPKVEWMLPTVVRDERHYQMMAEARKFLEPLAKVERLLGHQLNITPEILTERVEAAVAKQVEDHGVTVIPFSPEAVDWHRVVADAAFRRPPFQVGEKEKGFRDAMVLESFAKVVKDSPTTAASCRIVLVSGDELLRDAAALRTKESKNVHILESVDALTGLLNTLASTVDEQFIATVQPKAGKLFFESGQNETLYYKWALSSKLNAALAPIQSALPSAADRYELEKWIINPPRFVKKDGQRIVWTSRFEARLRAMKSAEWSTAPQSSGIIIRPGTTEPPLPLGYTAHSGLSSISPNVNISNLGFVSSPVAGGLFGGMTYSEPKLITTGSATVDVEWSASIATAGGFKAPKLGVVSYVQVVWN